jgi:predicted nucleic-acid-binding Zn-ribbon protein
MQECPKCRGRMAEGFMLDQGYGTVSLINWHAGKPQKSFWTGIRQSKEKYPLTTMRCERCGYLESYAPPR